MDQKLVKQKGIFTNFSTFFFKVCVCVTSCVGVHEK